jgi:uncharacterized damage-inducible protein DinB
MLETIRLFYDYTAWADTRVFGAASALPPEQWTRELGGSFKSVRDTIVHIAAAQGLWLERWRGGTPKGLWPASEFPTPASLRERWEPLKAELAAFVAAQTEESLQKPLSYKNLKGDAFTYPLGLLMLQVSNHSTYHRGQLTTLLRQLGAQPVSTDLLVYYLEQEKARKP